MSLTSDLREKGSVYRWFQTFANQHEVSEIIKDHNCALDVSRVTHFISPPNPVDFPLVGSAFTYALRDYFRPIETYLSDSVVGRELQKMGMLKDAIALLQVNKIGVARSALYVLFAYFESKARGRDLPTWINSRISLPTTIQMLTDSSTQSQDNRSIAAKLLIPVQVQNSILDVAQLSKILPIALGSNSLYFKRSDFYINPTFDNSDLVGGADCQMIFGGNLIDCRTTIASVKNNLPAFTELNLYQQIGYLLLDSADEFEVSHLTWYYSRHQTVFRYSVDNIITRLFQDSLEDLRESFEEWMLESRHSEPACFSDLSW